MRPAWFLSSLASWALAEAYMARSSPLQVFLGFLSFLIGISLAILVFAKIAELVRGTPESWEQWMRETIPSFNVLHFTLPAAILLRPLGGAGLAGYEIIKIILLFAVIKRLSLSIRALTGWPAWGASLLVFSPWMIGLGGLALGLLAVVGVGLVGLLGILAQ